MKWEDIIKLQTEESVHATVDSMIETMYSSMFEDATITEDRNMDSFDNTVDRILRPKLGKLVQEVFNYYKKSPKMENKPYFNPVSERAWKQTGKTQDNKQEKD